VFITPKTLLQLTDFCFPSRGQKNPTAESLFLARQSDSSFEDAFASMSTGFRRPLALNAKGQRIYQSLETLQAFFEKI